MYHFEETKNNVTKCLTPLVEKLKNDQDIVAIYLFGSFAAGMQTPLSDIDLAIILDHNLPPSRYFKKKLDLLAIVTSLLKTDAVDLVILNQAAASPIIPSIGKGSACL
ncbi:MAG: nucleotidyltransferase domain-containing protein [Candidatus Syntrophopropionicum ammoniitolerans]